MSADLEELDGLDDDTRLDVDPDGTPMFLDFLGRKNSGKSHLAELYARSWPYDGLVINTTGDVDPQHAWTTPWPGGERLVRERGGGQRPMYLVDWPERPEGVSRVMWSLRPNRFDPDHREKTDAAIAALHHAGDKARHPDATPRLFWADEIGEVAPAGQTLPGMEVVLHEGRHNGDWCIFCGPRPVDVDPLVLAQADWVFVFHMPAVHDVARVARTCGIPEADLSRLVRGLEGHGFVRIDQGSHVVAVYPPVPA